MLDKVSQEPGPASSEEEHLLLDRRDPGLIPAKDKSSSDSGVNLFHLGSTFDEPKFVGKKKMVPSTKERRQLPPSKRFFLTT